MQRSAQVQLIMRTYVQARALTKVCIAGGMTSDARRCATDCVHHEQLNAAASSQDAHHDF